MRRPSLADEGGFTLVELLLTMAIGLVILSSATLITSGAARHNNQVASRVDANQRGRLAMERIVQDLRSQVCVISSEFPLAAADDHTITFFSDTSDGSKPIEQHTIVYDPATRRITDSVVQAGPGETFTGPANTTVMATDVDAPASGAVFRYFAYPATATPLVPNVELGRPVTGLDLGRISRIDLSFLTTGDTASTANIRADMTDQVFVRLARPNDTTTPNPVYNPTCT